jgi:hypothetical protein
LLRADSKLPILVKAAVEAPQAVFKTAGAVAGEPDGALMCNQSY